MEKARVVGKDHFLTVWGGGWGCWWDLRGECPKRWFGGGRQKNIWYKGGGHQTNSFKFCSDGFCDKANNLPECQKPAFLDLRKVQISPGKHTPGPSTFFNIMHKKAILPH